MSSGDDALGGQMTDCSGGQFGPLSDASWGLHTVSLMTWRGPSGGPLPPPQSLTPSTALPRNLLLEPHFPVAVLPSGGLSKWLNLVPVCRRLPGCWWKGPVLLGPALLALQSGASLPTRVSLHQVSPHTLRDTCFSIPRDSTRWRRGHACPVSFHED